MRSLSLVNWKEGNKYADRISQVSISMIQLGNNIISKCLKTKHYSNIWNDINGTHSSELPSVVFWKHKLTSSRRSVDNWDSSCNNSCRVDKKKESIVLLDAGVRVWVSVVMSSSKLRSLWIIKQSPAVFMERKSRNLMQGKWQSMYMTRQNKNFTWSTTWTRNSNGSWCRHVEVS